jgi:hypothetical protein
MKFSYLPTLADRMNEQASWLRVGSTILAQGGCSRTFIVRMTRSRTANEAVDIELKADNESEATDKATRFAAIHEFADGDVEWLSESGRTFRVMENIEEVQEDDCGDRGDDQAPDRGLALDE